MVGTFSKKRLRPSALIPLMKSSAYSGVFIASLSFKLAPAQNIPGTAERMTTALIRLSCLISSII